MWENIKLPLVILSSPRSGSTVLLDTIRNYLNDNNVNFTDIGSEPITHEDRSFERYEKLNHNLTTNNFICKLHVFQLKTIYPMFFFDNILQGKYFLIRIRRKNIAEQLVSLYISHVYGEKEIFQNSKESNKKYIENKKIPIDKFIMEQVIIRGMHHIHLLENFNCKFDLDLWYEDIIFNSKKYYKPKPPSNYKELVDRVSNIVQDKTFDSLIKTIKVHPLTLKST